MSVLCGAKTICSVCFTQELMSKMEQMEVAMTQRQKEVCIVMRNVLFPSLSYLSSLFSQEEVMVVMEKEKRCTHNNNIDISYEFSSLCKIGYLS